MPVQTRLQKSNPIVATTTCQATIVAQHITDVQNVEPIENPPVNNDKKIIKWFVQYVAHCDKNIKHISEQITKNYDLLNEKLAELRPEMVIHESAKYPVIKNEIDNIHGTLHGLYMDKIRVINELFYTVSQYFKQFVAERREEVYEDCVKLNNFSDKRNAQFQHEANLRNLASTMIEKIAEFRKNILEESVYTPRTMEDFYIVKSAMEYLVESEKVIYKLFKYSIGLPNKRLASFTTFYGMDSTEPDNE